MISIMKQMFTSTIDAISEKTRLRNHRFIVIHTCLPEELRGKVKAAMIQFLQTPEGQKARQDNDGNFTYDEMVLLPKSILDENGIVLIRAEKAEHKLIVNLDTLFCAQIKPESTYQEGEE